MLCFETNKDTTSIRSSPIAFMYRNLPSDTSQPSTDASFFQPPYNQRMNQPQSYPPTTFGPAQTTFSTNDHAPSGSGLGHEYSSQFFVSDLNQHFHGEATPSHCSWGAGGFYPADNLHSGLNSWDQATQSLHSHIHSGGLGSPSVSGFPTPTATGQSSILDASDAAALPSVSLTGIDCFSAGSDAGSSGSFHLPVMQQRSLSSQRRPYEWISKNAYQNPQTQQGKTRTKDKYRVVYSDHQRLELEKEFRFSRYITIRRKSELASQLCLSERQVKIWFQNRRAKERKASKKNTSVGGNSGEDQDGLDDGEASDNSGHGVESPSAVASLSPTSSRQHGLILGFNQRPDATSGVDSPLVQTQDGVDDISSHSSQMPYPYPIESQGQSDSFASIPVDIDIKPPLLTSTDEACCVTTSSVDNARSPKTVMSSANAGNDLRRL